MRILIFGSTSWIGSTKLLEGNHLVFFKVRLDDFDFYLESVFKQEKITHVLMAAGLAAQTSIL